MYDFLLVGCGLSACTVAAKLKHKYKICIVDMRTHIGGNCYDYKADTEGTYVQMYGPHYFHTSNQNVVDFLSDYTEWREYTHKVTNEIQLKKQLKRVPFPYSKETVDALGHELSPHGPASEDLLGGAGPGLRPRFEAGVRARR